MALDVMDQLIREPDFFERLEKLNRFADEEKVLRQRFYQTAFESKKVEFVLGETVVQEPSRLVQTDVSENLFSLLSMHADLHDLGAVYHEKLLISLSRNDYEPDICFFTKERAVSFTPGQMQFPAPDFIVEVLSDSTEERDRGIKMIDYAAHGVREYWLVHPEHHTVEVYLPAPGGGKFMPSGKQGSGVIESSVITGFSIRVTAIFDRATNVLELRRMVGDATEKAPVGPGSAGVPPAG